MKTLRIIMIALPLIVISAFVIAKERYGEKLCSKNPHFYCHKVKKGETWTSLFPIREQQDVVRRVNRINLGLSPGMIIAVPRNLEQITHFDVSPFPLKIEPLGERWVRVDLSVLAWGAYDEEGNLVHWGPVSGGRKWCTDINGPCRTATGNYRVQNKQGYNCVSSIFPKPYGGAAMPFCMHYSGGFALHGSFDVPGYNDSHGCVRMFINDARWLNENFVDLNTKVTVEDGE